METYELINPISNRVEATIIITGFLQYNKQTGQSIIYKDPCCNEVLVLIPSTYLIIKVKQY